MTSDDSKKHTEDPPSGDLTPQERAWLQNPDNEQRGYQPKARQGDPLEPPPPPEGRASPSPHRASSGDSESNA